MSKCLEKRVGWICLAVLVAATGCLSTSKTSDGKAEGDWGVAYTSDFTDARTTTDKWFCPVGQTKFADGKLTLLPGQKNSAVLMLDGLSFPGNVRVEVIGSVTSTQKLEYLSFNICLNTDGSDANSGYLLQYGTKGNTCSLLKKNDGVVTSTVNKTNRPEAGNTYKIVAEKLGNRISLSVDGVQVFSYTDPTPLKDPMLGNIGLFTWGCSLLIDQVTVYTQKGHPEDVVFPMAPPAGGTNVTLRGILLQNSSTVPDPAHAERYQVLDAVEGTPEISAAWERMMQDCWPGDGLDCDQALRLNEEVERNVKYYVAPGQKAMRTHKGDGSYGQWPTELTGVVTEKDGQKWIFPTKIAWSGKSRLAYPAKMLCPDKPLALPGKEALVLKVDEKVSLKCVLLPAGRYVQGSPFFQTRYQDEYPHEVVLTKPFWMAEIPVTQELYESLMGNNPNRNDAKMVGPHCPVEHIPFANIEEFCRKLSEKTNRKVRLPTCGEWEYAARVGTSSPCITAKYKAQISYLCEKPNCPVKSAQPNAWGLYDMETYAEQVLSDWFRASGNARAKEIDPTGCAMSAACNWGSGPMHWAKGERWYGDLFRPNFNGVVTLLGQGGEAPTIFRVAVDATPEEIAEMAKK